MEARHRKITEIALAAAGGFGFALAGGYAIRAHGIGQRPSGDVDLFTGWDRRGEFEDAVAAIISALRGSGYEVSVESRAETFARLTVTADGESDKVELAADWRSHPPVTLEVGPVLHSDDAVSNKMLALYGRALPRDFLDIDAVLVSKRYTEDRLLELASNADAGFDERLFAEAIGMLDQINDEDFMEYGVAEETIPQMRRRFRDWAGRLRDRQ